MVKYYDGRLDQTILLTKEEKEFIAEQKRLTVGYLEEYYPFSYENNGEYAGLTRQVLEEVSVSTGLFFEYVKLEDLEEAKEALKDGRIHILGYCGESSANMKAEGLAVTKVYAQVPQVIIMRRNDKSDTIATLSVEEGNRPCVTVIWRNIC